jgi:hypothetical protein
MARAIAVVVLLMVVLAASCGGGEPTVGGQPNPTSSAPTSSGPTSSDPTSDPPESAEEWQARFQDAMGDWGTAFSQYSLAYSKFNTELNNWKPSDGPVEDALAKAVVGIDRSLDRLGQAEAAYKKLVPLADIALKKGGVPEVVSGDVSESDVRRYFVVIGDYIDASRQGLVATKNCYSRPPQAAAQCSLSLADSPQSKKLLATFRELDDLQFELFGQHLTPT